MKRKVKFQEGGAVDEPSPRSRQLRERMEKFRREGTRIQGAERERARQVAERDTARATRIPPSPRPSSVTPVGNLPPRIPAPPRPSMVRSMGEVMRPPSPAATSAASRAAGGLAGAALAGGAALAPALMERGRATMERRGAEADARREANLQAFRSREQTAPADGPAAGSMQNARPTARPRPRPARPAEREEVTAEELNQMVLDQLEGRRRQPRTMPMAQARDNIELAMGRDTQPEIGSVQREDFRRGGMIAAKPKKAAPKKPMPFKKGGAIKMKGKK